MTLGKRSLIALALALCAATPKREEDLKAAEAFLRGIYATYKANGTPAGVTGAEAEKILAPALLALSKAAQQVAEGEVGSLDGDPICDCQDFDISSVEVAVKPAGKGKARATARFVNLGQPTEVKFDLVSIRGAWRIANIHGKSLPDLKRAWESDIAAAENRKRKQ